MTSLRAAAPPRLASVWAVARRFPVPSFLAPGHAIEAHGDAIWSFVASFVDGDRIDLEARLRSATRVLLFRGLDGAITGLVGLRVIDLVHDGEPVRVLYTHDVLVDPSARGANLTQWAGLLSFVRFGWLGAPARVYWFADFCSYRGYRIVAHGLEDAWPVVGRDIPTFERGLYDRLCTGVCAEAFHPATGTTRAVSTVHRDPQRAPASLVARDPHVRFFVERNPGYLSGDGLPAVARLGIQSLVRAATRRPGARGGATAR